MKYAVTVGNIGIVHHESDDYDESKKVYDEYVDISNNDKTSRAYEESVVLWGDDEPIEEYTGPQTLRESGELQDWDEEEKE